MQTLRWVATLSNGETVEEHKGEYQLVDGERKPWVRLTQFLAREKLHLTSLKLYFNGKLITLPTGDLDKFGMTDFNQTPDRYSLQYHLEGEIDPGGLFTQTHYIDLAAHYGELDNGFAVHYVLDITNEKNSWIVVTRGMPRMSMTPRSPG